MRPLIISKGWFQAAILVFLWAAACGADCLGW